MHRKYLEDEAIRLPVTYSQFPTQVCPSATGGQFSPQCAVAGFSNFTFTSGGKNEHIFLCDLEF